MPALVWERPEWYDRANCAGLGPDMFYVESKGTTMARARQVCAGCEVRDECLAAALERPEQFGMWGGLAFRQRAHLRGRRAS